MARDVAASFSFSTAFSPKKYDVFLSFRGKDTRTNFISHLYTALCHKQILTYTDEMLSKGDEISASLRQAIQDSYISIVVFSKNYASSTWCLDELTKVLHCKRFQGQLVIPVFYKVKPSYVRNQIGTYLKAFQKHEQDLKNNQHKVHKWRAALIEAANLAGWDSFSFRNESELVQNIVKDILQKLDHTYWPIELNGLVGIDNNCTQIESLLLSEVKTIGIWGMSGTGKTTIARALFVKYSSQYEGRCFLANIRKNSRKHGNGLHDLRCKLLSKLSKEKGFYIGTSTIEYNFKSMLSGKKVFIVLDDVTTLKQLEYLVGEFHCFGPGSKIIITTRKKHVLRRMIGVICKVKKLKFPESLKLFSLNAFNQSLLLKGCEELSKQAIVYARGIPLVLKVLGSFLHSKTKTRWNSTLRKLKKYTYLSYGMISNLCNMHLPRGVEWYICKIWLEHYGYCLKSLPSTFCPEKLVELSMPYNHVEKLWDEVQDLVNLKEINLAGSQQLIKLPGFSKALNLKKVYLDGCKNLHHVDPFILSLHSLDEFIPNGCCKPKSLQSEILVSSEEKRILDLSLHSSSGRSNKLEELNFVNLILKNFLKELSCIKSLTKLDLSNCEQIDNWKLHILFGGLWCLRAIYLDDCCNITKLPSSIKHLSRLQVLNLRNCKRLRSLPKLPPSIQRLNASNCVKLEEQSLHNIAENAHSSMMQVAFARRAQNKKCTFCWPGSRVLKRFTREAACIVSIELPPPSYLVGFIFSVVSHLSLKEARIHCECYLGNSMKLGRSSVMSTKLITEMNLDHVYQWYDPFNCGKILKRIIEGRRRDEQFVATNLKVFFKFSIETDKLDSIGIKERGVCPIYVSKYNDLVPKMEFRSNLNTNSKRHRDVDEQEPLPQCKKQGLKSSHDVNELFRSNLDTNSKRSRDVNEQESQPQCKTQRVELFQDVNELEALLMRINIT